MASNFLRSEGGASWRGIISANELMAREGVDLRKGMNYRKEPQLSVFLVLPSHGGEYRDEWHADKQLYIYEGHESTIEGGKAKDQLMMYESGRLSDNGKFYKAAKAYKDGIQKEPMQIQVYEKLDPGVWYDKGIFDLIDAQHVAVDGRKVFKFFLRPADASDPSSWDRYRAERMLPVTAKVAAWAAEKGRCEMCGSENELHFVGAPPLVHLLCALHVSS
jgi:hypothetical protein